jgi:hypothetical protein
MENRARDVTGAGAEKASNPQGKAYPKFAHNGWTMRKSGADARERGEQRRALPAFRDEKNSDFGAD